MELLELKSVWKAVIDESILKDTIDTLVVENSIKKDSKSVLGKIKSVMYFKFIFGTFSVLATSVMFIGSFINPDQFTFLETICSLTDNRILLATIIAFMTAMLSWNFRAFGEIKQFERNTTNIKVSLEKFIGIMAQTIKLNVYSSMVFNSVAIGWFAYLLNNTQHFIEGTFQITLVVAVVVMVSAITFYFISSYEQKVKFGNHLDQLKSNLYDLDEK